MDLLEGPSRGRSIVLALAACLVFAAALAAPALAASPGANGKIAYDSFSFGDRKIVVINADGTGNTPLSQNGVNDREPAWSPDGLRIVFVRQDPNTMQGEIRTMNADGTNVSAPLTVAASGGDSEPAFSGDGTRIVFSRTNGSDREIWVMNADGSAETPLTGGGFDFEPTFSPDSQRIAFVREVAGQSFDVDEIFVMAADGSGDIALTTDAINAGGPNFSPDGTQLTFSRCIVVVEGCPVNEEIVRMPSGGGLITEVTSNGGSDSEPNDLDPVFSPDGAQIAFTRLGDFGFTADIFTVSSLAGAGTPLTATGDEQNPDWQPLAADSAGAFGRPKGRCFGEDITMFGTTGNDKLVGTPGPDVIRGYTGNDRINGRGDGDVLCGGRGEDKIFGKGGPDILVGGDGDDFLKGGPGINRLFGGTLSAGDEKANNVCVLGPQDTGQNCQVRKP